MLVNTGTSAQNGMSIAIDNFTAAVAAKVYQSIGGGAPAAAANATVANGTISGFSIAASSVTLIEATH